MWIKIKNYILVFAVLIAAFFAGRYSGNVYLSKSGMSDEACSALASKITERSKYISKDYGNVNKSSMSTLKELNDFFIKNCQNRKITPGSAGPKQESIQPVPDKSCEAIEFLLMEEMPDDASTDSSSHLQRASQYSTMFTHGCAENRSKHKAMAVRSLEISRALNLAPDDWRMMIYKDLGMTNEAAVEFERIRKSGKRSDEELLNLQKNLFE